MNELRVLTMKHSNQLIQETSPYLLQHAHNPVNWYPWGEEALRRAREENKPILVSIGYAACHWCHVMERESFENEETAAIMNEHFINIKIDREERPDLDHIYMDAVQAMTGSGGWPLNVFLTPDRNPFYGGTYFPPKRAYNRPSWQETLHSVIQAFRERRHEIDAQAGNLTAHLLQSNSFGLQKNAEAEFFVSQKCDEVFQNIMKQADREWGGFGRAPKFPQTGSIQFLLRYSYLNSIAQNDSSESPTPPLRQEKGSGAEAALQQALLSLDKMIEGGIYDQAGGGFARYSTDTEWLAPHFEKMLYDNALLLSVLSEAYQLTKKERYREVIDETMDFIRREMLQPDNGFYAAIDADSEGVEGKFYVWQLQEVKELLGGDADIFCAYFDITEKGNWEHTNILRVKKSLEQFAAEKGRKAGEVKELLLRGKQKLLQQREKRIRPLLDDKIILGWNALMNTAASKAFAATGNEGYRKLALDNMAFILSVFKTEKGFHHTWKEGQAKYPAFLDDLAYLAEALLHLQEISGDTAWLEEAKKIAGHVQDQFREEGTGFFFYTPVGQEDVIVRKKEVYDSAVPSGNAVMAFNLYRLGILLDKPDWKQQAMENVSALGNAVVRYPTSFSYWACLLQEMTAGTYEIAVVGEGFGPIRDEILQNYLPHRVLMGAAEADPNYPVLAGRKVAGKLAIHLCSNYTCQLPVFSAKELILLINKGQKQ